MESLIYLYTHSLKNKIKKALRKPVTILYLIGIIAYGAFILIAFNGMFKDMEITDPTGFVMILSFFALLTIPTNIFTYSKKKGLIFQNSDVHFLFSAPVNPKLILLYAQSKQFFLSLIFNLFILIGGCVWFHISPWRMIVFFVVSFLIENLLESSLMIVLFGNEVVSEKGMNVLRWVIKGIVILLIAFLGFLFVTEKASFAVVFLFLNHPFLQMIPIAGWNIAFVRLLILGPTTLNMIATGLYCVTAITMFIIAKKMKCQGEYFEEAMTFAEDYAVAMEKSKKGEIGIVGKKKKFKKAKVEYKGNYAKAIFYRQLLEYKKNRFFIFGIHSLVCLAAGIGIAFFVYHNPVSGFQEFVIPGVGIYITFIFSGYMSKWTKELSNPYTFLIPDSPMRKLWYSTLIEHIRALIDGCLLTIPGAIMLKLSPIQTILIILIYVCLQANKLYINVLAEALLGSTLGNVGKQILRMFVQGFIMALAIIAAVLGVAFINAEAGFILGIIVTVGMTSLAALGASTLFAKMEALDG